MYQSSPAGLQGAGSSGLRGAAAAGPTCAEVPGGGSAPRD